MLKHFANAALFVELTTLGSVVLFLVLTAGGLTSSLAV